MAAYGNPPTFSCLNVGLALTKGFIFCFVLSDGTFLCPSIAQAF